MSIERAMRNGHYILRVGNSTATGFLNSDSALCDNVLTIRRKISALPF